MVYEWQVLLAYWAPPLSFAIILARVCWISFVRQGRPSYDDLLEERERLHGCVIHWKYPDGTFVPQHKRQRMFKDLRKLSHQIRNHPDRPDGESPVRQSV